MSKEQHETLLASIGENALAFAQGIISGPTLHMADKAEAWISSETGHGTYEQQLNKLKDFENAHKIAFVAGEVTGVGATIAVPGSLLLRGGLGVVKTGLCGFGVVKGAATLGIVAVAAESAPLAAKAARPIKEKFEVAVAHAVDNHKPLTTPHIIHHHSQSPQVVHHHLHTTPRHVIHQPDVPITTVQEVSHHGAPLVTPKVASGQAKAAIPPK